MKMKKMFALTLGATMAMGTAMPVMASDPTVTAPIYSFEKIDVVVPTTYKVAFNPEGLTVKTDDSTGTSTDQILSKNYGILNKSNKDMVCKVTLKVTDKNTGANKVEFVDSADDVTNAKDGEYKIHLVAVPADDTEVKVGTSPASADKDTAAASLDDVTMTKAADAKAVTLKGGENKVAFKLLKAEYQAVAGSEVTLGSTSANDVKDNYEIKALAGTGKGITAFTFSGSMNAKADWTKLQSGIEITSVYSPIVAPSDATVITGTGAMIEVGTDMNLSSSGAFSITGLTADDNLASLSIEVPNGSTFAIDANPVELNMDNWSEESGGSITGQLGTVWMDYLRGESGTTKLKLTLVSGAIIEATATIQ